jgi:hypothetical protein
MREIDWSGIPLEGFTPYWIQRPDGSQDLISGFSGRLMVRLASDVEVTFEELLSEEDFRRLETTGEVPLIRGGQRGFEPLDKLTLRDLPAILDTFEVLKEELEARQIAESERKAAARKERERVRAKERRKLKKLGEW